MRRTDSNVMCFSVSRATLLAAMTVTLGCGSSSPKSTADGGQADVGEDGSPTELYDSKQTGVDAKALALFVVP